MWAAIYLFLEGKFWKGYPIFVCLKIVPNTITPYKMGWRDFDFFFLNKTLLQLYDFHGICDA